MLNRKGQLSVIAALLVAVILVATVIVTYSLIRSNPIEEQPPIQSAIDETNFAIKQILGFTVGYYGSVLEVTGNSSYAKTLAMGYLQSGMENIVNMHPEWATSLCVNNSELYTCWFENVSYSQGDLAVTYNLTALGISGVNYRTSCKLDVRVTGTGSNQSCLSVSKDEDEPLINLGRQNFKFFRYESINSTWESVNPTREPIAYANGTYQIDVPAGVDLNSYFVQVEDPRGIIVVASSFSQYTCSLSWNSTLYSSLQNATLVVELLQNGTMRWLGQNLQLTTEAKPVPPIPVKAIHLNQTINGAEQEVPFQIEDWASDYSVPLGLTNNASIFSSRTMLVFLANSNVSKVTVWWDGRDIANQTSYAITNRYFTVDTSPSQRTLSNGILTLKIDFTDPPGAFRVNSTIGTSQSTAVFMRINNKTARYGSSEPMWAIVNGPVRLVLQQEVEWGSSSQYQIPNCPNVYAHIVLTLPANATYYTYRTRLMFMETQQNRNITDLCPISLTSSINQLQTENGTRADGYPIVSNATGLFFDYNFPATPWTYHHWGQFVSGTKGTGIMFTDTQNGRLYAFDTTINQTVGAVKANSTEKRIELLPVSPRASVSFQNALDVGWEGAVVTSDNTTPIYNSTNGKGLWIIVEYPPTITVAAEE